MPQGRSVGGVIERIDNLHPAVTRGAGVVFHVAAYIKALKVSDAGNPAVKERAAAATRNGRRRTKRWLRAEA